MEAIKSKRLLSLVPPQEGEDPVADEALMLRAAAGENAAFDLLVTRHQERIRRFTHTLLKDRRSSEEAAQEVFLKLWQSRLRYQSNDKFHPLLFTIARNHCLSILRRRSLRRLVGIEELDELDELEFRSGYPTGFVDSENTAADERLHARRTELQLRHALEQLPEKFRTPLMLRFVEELPYEDIARIIGRTTSAARSRVHYGIKALARHLPPEMAPWNV